MRRHDLDNLRSFLKGLIVAHYTFGAGSRRQHPAPGSTY